MQKSLITSLNKSLKKEIFKKLDFKNEIYISDLMINKKEKNCLKEFYLGLFQRNFDVYSLMCSEKLRLIYSDLGLLNPYINSDPLTMLHINSSLFSNTFSITNSPWHQDWLSMQGSINSIVLWIPLVDINNKTGGIHLIESSHKKGLIEAKKDDWFASIDNDSSNVRKGLFVKPNPKAGDALIFSSLLVHKTLMPQILDTNTVRLTLQFRISDYNCDLLRKNNWHFNYNHCLPKSNIPPKNKP